MILYIGALLDIVLERNEDGSSMVGRFKVVNGDDARNMYLIEVVEVRREEAKDSDPLEV